MRALLLLLPLALIGCVAESDDGSSEEDALKVTSGYRYDCARYVNGTPVRVAVALTSKASTLTYVRKYDDGRVNVGEFQFDPGYTPKTQQSYARFLHVAGEGTADSILVYKPMRDGAASGSLKLQFGGDAFSSYFYKCTRTTAALDTKEPKPVAPAASVVAKLGSTGNFYTDPPANQPDDMFVYSMWLRPDGTYYAINVQAGTESGVWTAANTKLPIKLKLQSGSFAWTATLSKTGVLAYQRAGLSATLTAPQ